MELLELIRAIKIDFTKTYIAPDSAEVLDYEFDISPKMFLSYSKQDFKSGETRGMTNALSNAKRAIDCQTDKIFHSIGLTPDKFPSVIEDFINKSSLSISKKDIPIKLRFLQAMSFAPAEIISNSRLLRHKLEHYYNKPAIETVSNAIDLAELFILATDSKLRNLWGFYISDTEKKDEKYLWNSMYFEYNPEKYCFKVRIYIGKKKQKDIQYNNTNIEFYYLLKIATSFDYKEDIESSLIELLTYIGHPIPAQHIKVEAAI